MPSFRRFLIVVIGFLGVIALAVVVGLPFYVFPRVDAPGPTDVVYVIGPPTATRLAVAERMLDEGLSDTLLISVSDPGDVGLCAEPTRFTVYCARPEPFTTQGEARYLAAMAAEHGWSTATVIADTTALPLAEWAHQYFHQTGAFMKVALSPGC